LETAPGHRRARHRQSCRLTRATAIAWEGTDSINGPLPSLPPSLSLSLPRARAITADTYGRARKARRTRPECRRHRAVFASSSCTPSTPAQLEHKEPIQRRTTILSGDWLPAGCSLGLLDPLVQHRPSANAARCTRPGMHFYGTRRRVAFSLGARRVPNCRLPKRSAASDLSFATREKSLSLSLSLDCRLIGETKKRLATFLPQRVLVLTKVRDNTDHRSMILRACRF
jgi:hypothetical protein